MRLRWKKHILWPLVFLLVLLAVTIYILLGTGSGNQWLLRQFLPEQNLSYRQWQGDVLSGVTIRDVHYQDDTLDVASERLFVSLNFWSLLSMTVDVEALQLDATEVHLKPSQSEPSNNTEMPIVRIPIDIRAPAVTVKNLKFSGGFEHLIESVQLNAAVEDNVIHIWELAYRDPQLSANIDGELNLLAADSKGFRYQLHVEQADLSANAQGTISKRGHDFKLSGQASMTAADTATIESLTYDVLLSDQSQLTATVNASGWVKQDTQQLNFQQARIEGHSDFDAFDVNIHAPVVLDANTEAVVTAVWKGTVAESDLTASVQSDATGQLDIDSQWRLDNGVQGKGQISSAHFDLMPWLQQSVKLTDLQVPFQLLLNENSGLQARVSGLKTEVMTLSEPVAVTADAAYENDQLTLSVLKLQSSDNAIELSGNMSAESLDIKLLSEDFDVSLLMPEVAAIIDGEAVLSGSPQQPHVALNASVAGIQYEDVQIARAQLKGQGVFPELDLTVNLGSSQLAGYALDSVAVDITSAAENMEISLAAQDVAGRAFELGYDGTVDFASGVVLQGQLQKLSLDLADLGQWKLSEASELRMDTSQSDITLAPICLDGGDDGRVCLEAAGDWTAQDAASLNASVEIDALSLDWWQRLQLSPVYVDGAVSGQLAYQNGGVQGQLDLENAQLVYVLGDTTQRKNIEHASIDVLSDGTDLTSTLDVRVVDIGEVQGNVQLLSYADTDAEITGDLSARLNSINSLPAVLPMVAEAQGAVNWTVDVKGPLNAPQLNASGALSDGYILLAQNGMRLDQLSFDVTQTDADQLTFEVLTKQQSEQLTLTGKINALWDVNRSVEAQLETTDFTFFDVPELKLKGSSALQLLMQSSEVSLTGDIELTEGHFTGYEVTPAISVSEDTVIHGVSDGAVENPLKTNLDIGIKIPTGLKVDALGLNAKVLGQLRLQTAEQSQQLGGYGQLELKDGSYEIYGQQLAIEQGLLDFNGSLSNPGLSVTAKRVIDTNLVVGVRMGGTVNQPKSSLYSNPSLPETDILSYLITGRNLNEGTGDSENQLAQAATLLGVKSVLPKLQSALGVDLIRVDQSRGSKNTALEVEKSLSKNLTIGYSYGLFNEVGFWLLKYQLNKALRLESAYGETQAVDLIYSIKRD